MNTYPTVQEVTMATQFSKGYIEKAMSEATKRAYGSDVRKFNQWCTANNVASLPASPVTVAEYLAHCAKSGKKASTISRSVAAIRYVHKVYGFETPTTSPYVTATLSGIKRELGTVQEQKKAISTGDLVDMIEKCPDTLIGLRDKAILALGFSGAFRRSELANLNVEDIKENQKGMEITIRRSKTDKYGQGQKVAIINGRQVKAIKHLKKWLAVAGIATGKVFRGVKQNGSLTASITGLSIGKIVKKYVGLIGLDSSDYGGHSLRAGYITEAAEHGASVFKIQEVSRHKRIDTVQLYVRNAELFRNHSGAMFL